MKTRAIAAFAADQKLSPFELERREPGSKDVQIEVLFSGICHSDIHQARGEWGSSKYPMVPGHEIIGRVLSVGAEVRKFKVGDIAGVGCMVDSCRTCTPCAQDHEQFCQRSPAFTYNSTEMDRTTPTYGGYARHIVVTEHFVLKVPPGLPLEGAAPLLCAGITTYSPLRQWNCKKGDRVGVVGLGGLGHMAVKLANAMGAEVTILSTSKAKEADALKLGARTFALTTDRSVLKGLAGQFDLLIDTVSAPHDLNLYLSLLKPFGAMTMVGASPQPLHFQPFSLISNNRRLAGSNIGGIKETQEMLDFCAQHQLMADVEVIAAEQINEAYERMLKNDVRYRFVIDASTI